MVRRWGYAGCLVALASLVGGGGSASAAAVPVLVVRGEGWGHGVGMAQDGAFAMASDGASTEAILGHFYPGTGLGRATGAVRVVVLQDADRDTLVELPNGGEVRSPRNGQQAPGFPVRFGPGGVARLRVDGGIRVIAVNGRLASTSAGRGRIQAQLLPIVPPPTTPLPTAPPPPAPPKSPPTTAAPTTTAPPAAPPPPQAQPGEPVSAGPVWVVPPGDGVVGVPDRTARYRGVVQAVDVPEGLRLVDELDVEQYLRGMGEMPAAWPAAALGAQAIASRTYAMRAMSASGELCDDQRCQVYLGQQAERPSSDAAVRATAGKVLSFRGALASTVFSANGGGVSATPSEGFGTPDDPYPYLRAAPYPSRTPDVWESRISLVDLAPRLRYPGRLTAVSVATTGPSGRATTLAVDGSAGARDVAALDLVRALGLRSTKWVVEVVDADAPPPPPEADLVQVLPEETALPATTVVPTAPRRTVAAGLRHDGGGTPDRTVPVAATVALAILAAGALAARDARRTSP